MIERFQRAIEVKNYIKSQADLRNEYVWFNSLSREKRIEYMRDRKVFEMIILLIELI